LGLGLGLGLGFRLWLGLDAEEVLLGRFAVVDERLGHLEGE
jgi:hypothetical protein